MRWQSGLPNLMSSNYEYSIFLVVLICSGRLAAMVCFSVRIIRRKVENRLDIHVVCEPDGILARIILSASPRIFIPGLLVCGFVGYRRS